MVEVGMAQATETEGGLVPDSEETFHGFLQHWRPSRGLNPSASGLKAQPGIITRGDARNVGLHQTAVNALVQKCGPKPPKHNSLRSDLRERSLTPDICASACNSLILSGTEQGRRP